MRYEVVMYWAECDNEFHYIVYVNGNWLGQFCNLHVTLERLRNYLRRF